jgi:hypothetical protein
MSDVKKTVAEWEKEKAMLIDIPEGTEVQYTIINDEGKSELVKFDFDLNEEVTSDNFFEKFYTPQNRDKVRSVHHGDRQDWLEANEYEVNRANMLDTTLLTKAEKDAIEAEKQAEEAILTEGEVK